MLVKFIYHSPPVFLLHLPELRRVYLPLGGRKGGGGGCKGRTGGSSGLSLREQRTTVLDAHSCTCVRQCTCVCEEIQMSASMYRNMWSLEV